MLVKPMREYKRVKTVRMKVANLVVERNLLSKELSNQRYLLSKGKEEHEQKSRENNRLNLIIRES